MIPIRARWVVWCLMAGCMACSDQEQPTIDLGRDYFPVSVGQFAIYQVEQIRYSQNIPTVSNYELKTQITDFRLNEFGDTSFVMHRWKRNSASDNWEPIETWSVSNSNYQVVQNEGNVLFVKLIFPPGLNVSWNGNEFNNLPENNELFFDGEPTPYIVSSLNESMQLTTGFSSDNTLTVLQNDRNDSFIGVDERTEVYARGVGLIYKELKQLKYCTNTPCYGQQKVDQGVVYIQQLKDYGRQ